MQIPQAEQFHALNIFKTRDGQYQASLQIVSGGGWRISIENTADDALAGLFEPVPVALPPCPVPLP